MPDGGTLTLSARVDQVRGDGGGDKRQAPAPGTYVCLTVADTGQGMDAQTLARATEPFFTTKPLGRGTGLGLAMAQGFAEGSGGALRIASDPGRGTQVSLWLPIAAGPAASAAEPAARDETAPATARCARPCRVLLVDDEPVVREVLAGQLADEGFEVAEAADGAAALALIERGGPFDLLVTDLAMPGQDGVALIREAQWRRPGLPAILLTGYAGEAAALAVGSALDGGSGGAFALLRKPITGARLADQAAALLAPARDRTARDDAEAAQSEAAT